MFSKAVDLITLTPSYSAPTRNAQQRTRSWVLRWCSSIREADTYFVMCDLEAP